MASPHCQAPQSAKRKERTSETCLSPAAELSGPRKKVPCTADAASKSSPSVPWPDSVPILQLRSNCLQWFLHITRTGPSLLQRVSSTDISRVLISQSISAGSLQDEGRGPQQ